MVIGFSTYITPVSQNSSKADHLDQWVFFQMGPFEVQDVDKEVYFHQFYGRPNDIYIFDKFLKEKEYHSWSP